MRFASNFASMGASSWLWLSLAVSSRFAVEAANTFAMTWGADTFGPDGPWYAVDIRVGSSKKLFSLYPGGGFSSHVLSPKVCQNDTLGRKCWAEDGGVYDPDASTTSSFGPIAVGAAVDFTGRGLNMGGSQGKIGTDTWDVGNDMETMREMNMAVHESAWNTLPDGSTYAVTLGTLALGPGDINQTFTRGNQPPLNATLLPGWLTTKALPNKILSSQSYGLHIGSVSPKIPPSLVFGGFDQNRALGRVSTQQVTDGYAIDLLDIGIEVIDGASPWTFKNQDGLLAKGNASIQGVLPLQIQSLTPYLHLPKSTCDAIAANLPVTYQAKYGLYFWNLEDAKYKSIVSSASALTFTFRGGQSAENLTIKVPFQLLNLTLEAPIIANPTPYFPCRTEETSGRYQLGRAFLQAAFIGANWDAWDKKGAWWLAQAPGPNTPTQSKILSIADSAIEGSPLEWASTWKGIWTPLAVTDGTPVGNTGTTPSPSASVNPDSNPSSGLSTGAKAGIGAGAGVGALLLIGLLFFFLRKRSRKEKQTTDGEPNQDYTVAPVYPQQSYHDQSGPYGQETAEMPVNGDGKGPVVGDKNSAFGNANYQRASQNGVNENGVANNNNNTTAYELHS